MPDLFGSREMTLGSGGNNDASNHRSAFFLSLCVMQQSLIVFFEQ